MADKGASERATAFPRRAAGARRTHQALVRAAAELFIEGGFAATTVHAIAERAGVARPTVFTSAPGGKAQLLREARDQALAGDDEPIPVPQRPWFRHAMSQTDPQLLIRLQSGNYRRIHERAAALERVLATAAEGDPGLAALRETAQRQRHAGAALVIARLDELEALRPRLTVPAATDTLYALTAPDLYLLLTGDRAWTAEHYEAWLAEELDVSLLTQS